jgi:predicted AAA+ superfamily ATPase
MKINHRPYTGSKLNVYRYLKEEPKARERSNKNRALANLLFKKFPQLQELDKDLLEDIARYTTKIDRNWRKVLEEKPELRGSDYLKTKRSSQVKALKEI